MLVLILGLDVSVIEFRVRARVRVKVIGLGLETPWGTKTPGYDKVRYTKCLEVVPNTVNAVSYTHLTLPTNREV